MEKVKLDDVLKYEQPTNYIVESTNYNNDYQTPVLTAGQSFILGYTNETENIFSDLPVIIFDDFTTAFKFVDFPFKVKSSAMKILKPVKEIADVRYLFYKMMTIDINPTQHKRYWISKYSQLQIPLPPIQEQKRIAAILDEADKIRQLNKKLIEHYEQLSQSLFLEMFGDPVVNPMGWDVKTLKNTTSKIGSGATPKGGKDSYKSQGISLIRSLNIHNGLFKYKDLAFIDDEQAYKLKNVIVEENDVLFNITGASVCRCAIVPKSVLPARVNQHVSIVRTISSELNHIYLNRLLISENFQKMLLTNSSQGGATREALTKEQVESIELPIPPINIQTQFAERVQELEHQKEQAGLSLQKSEDLFQSLLQRAFRGEL